MNRYYLIALAVLLTACNAGKSSRNDASSIDSIATEYVKLGLAIGRYDRDFVDAYYGPDSLRPAQADTGLFPKEQFLASISGLQKSLHELTKASPNDTIARRAEWLDAQLTAFSRRVHVFSGSFVPFDSESRELLDAVAPVYDEQHFKDLITRLDGILPGKGAIPERFQQLAGHFLVPKDKIDTVFQTAIAEARKRTLAHYILPKEEQFELEYVHDKPWSGYNWYQGDYKSLIQINISQPIYIDRAIDLACHEGYPGHHVYNALLEKNLFRGKGWTELSLYPLFSPQSLIAEGSANYGISMAFPGDEQKEFCKKLLMPLAGMDTTLADKYFEALAVRSALNFARNEVARGLLDKGMTDEQAKTWLKNYVLLPDKGAADYVRFTKKYRSYVINYNYGQEIIKKYIESQGGTPENPEKRWALFEKLLSTENKAGDLLKH